MLSIIITSLNEQPFILNKTIQSILETTPNNEIEIIVIDDNSKIVPDIKYKDSNIIVERNNFRIGVAQSRHIGATLASKKWLLFTDSHMRFEKNWYNNFLEYQQNSTKKTVYNGTCLGLWEDEFLKDVILNKLPHYYGARLSLYESKENQVLEAKWVDGKKNEDNYNISCLMGAIYFIQKEYFFNLRGLSDLRGWGSDEPCLSLKILQSDGEIKQLKQVKVAHMFRRNAPYSTSSNLMIYNKLRMIKTLIPDELQENLINKLNKDKIYDEAVELFNKENKQIIEYKNYYRSIFNIRLEDICKKYNINIT